MLCRMSRTGGNEADSNDRSYESVTCLCTKRRSNKEMTRKKTMPVSEENRIEAHSFSGPVA